MPKRKKPDNDDAFLTTLHGKVTDSVAALAGKKAKEDRVMNKKVVEVADYQFTLENYQKVSGTLGISTHKLSPFLSIFIQSKTEFR